MLICTLKHKEQNMKRLLIIIFVLFIQNASISQEKDLPNQITLWNPYDMQFTPDNNYLVVSSPNDSKIWNLENLECINISSNFSKDANSLDNGWAYLPDSKSFFFHQTDLSNEIYSINPDGRTKSVAGSLGSGKYEKFKFDNPSSFFLTSNTFLTVKTDKKYIPYIEIEKSGENKPLFSAKIWRKRTMVPTNNKFTVLKGEANIFYLLSFPKISTDNGEGIVTEINLNTQKTRNIAEGIEVYLGNNSYTDSRLESLKKSLETPNYIVLNLDGFIYAVRKSDGKIVENLKLKSLFSEKANPKICGERDGKLIVASQDWGKERGIVFHTVDFDSQKIVEQIFHFGIDVEWVKDYKVAISHNGKEFAIAYKWDEDKGYKVAYINTQKLSMLRDKEKTVENLLEKIEAFKKADEIAQKNRIAEMQKTPINKVISRAWYAVFDKNSNRTGLGFKLDCDAFGNISGYYEYRNTPSNMDKPSGFYTHYYIAQFYVTGHIIDKKSFEITIGDVKSICDQLEESSFKRETLTFEIQLNPNTLGEFQLNCKKWDGTFLDGYIDSHYF